MGGDNCQQYASEESPLEMLLSDESATNRGGSHLHDTIMIYVDVFLPFSSYLRPHTIQHLHNYLCIASERGSYLRGRIVLAYGNKFCKDITYDGEHVIHDLEP